MDLLDAVKPKRVYFTFLLNMEVTETETVFLKYSNHTEEVLKQSLSYPNSILVTVSRKSISQPPDFPPAG